MKKIICLFGVIISIFILSGCKPSHIVGDSIYGYAYGYMKVEYNANFEKAWKACEKTIAAMKGYDVIPEKSLGEGEIKSNIENDTVRFYLTYKTKDITEITIRVGNTGSKVASQLIQDKIKENLNLSTPTQPAN